MASCCAVPCIRYNNFYLKSSKCVMVRDVREKDVVINV